MSRSPTLSDPPAPPSVIAARAVAHAARLLAVLSVAAQAGMFAMEVGWVLEGRQPFADVIADKSLPFLVSVLGALAVWWLSARVLASTRSLVHAPAGRP